jgi:predicted lipid-binding transport protein (Tim44 family)
MKLHTTPTLKNRSPLRAGRRPCSIATGGCGSAQSRCAIFYIFLVANDQPTNPSSIMAMNDNNNPAAPARPNTLASIVAAAAMAVPSIFPKLFLGVLGIGIGLGLIRQQLGYLLGGVLIKLLQQLGYLLGGVLIGYLLGGVLIKIHQLLQNQNQQEQRQEQQRQLQERQRQLQERQRQLQEQEQQIQRLEQMQQERDAFDLAEVRSAIMVHGLSYRHPAAPAA